MNARLTQNAVYVPETDSYYVSTHHHDYVAIELPDGKMYDLDGGLSYVRRCGDLELRGTRVIEICLTDQDPFDLICRRLLWGSRGKDGTESLTYRPIALLSLPHLRAIKKTQEQIKGTMSGKVVDHWIAHHAREAVAAKRRNVKDKAA